MAFESDDDDKSPAPRGSKSDPSELGRLAADLPPSERRSSAPPGPDADDSIDAAALAALSKGQHARVAADADDGRVKLKGAPVGPASVPSSSAPPSTSSYGWLIGLAIGFAVGVPVGGVLFPRTTVVSIPAAPKGASAPSEAQLAAAEARARAADAIAAAVQPLPGKRLAEQAQAAAEPPTTEAPAAASPPAAEPGTGETPVAAAQPGAAAPAAQPAAAAPAAKKPAGPDAQAREAARAATAALNANPSAAAAPPPAAQPAAPAQAPAPAAQPAAAPATGPDGRSVDDLLDQALSSSIAKKEQERADRALAAEAQANAIPVSPSREDVQRAMTVILPAIRGCAAGQSGLATVGIVVRNDGHVESVSVTGAPFEGERSGRCMEGVVRRAKFPRFQQSSFRIQFPLAIQ